MELRCDGTSEHEVIPMIEATGNTTTAGVVGEELSDTERHRILASEYRRVLLEVLSDRGRPTSLEALGSAVDDRLDPDGTVHDSERELRILLHHKHLPALASAGVVDYDHERQRVDF